MERGAVPKSTHSPAPRARSIDRQDPQRHVKPTSNSLKQLHTHSRPRTTMAADRGVPVSWCEPKRCSPRRAARMVITSTWTRGTPIRFGGVFATDLVSRRFKTFRHRRQQLEQLALRHRAHGLAVRAMRRLGNTERLSSQLAIPGRGEPHLWRSQRTQIGCIQSGCTVRHPCNVTLLFTTHELIVTYLQKTRRRIHKLAITTCALRY